MKRSLCSLQNKIYESSKMFWRSYRTKSGIFSATNMQIQGCEQVYVKETDKVSRKIIIATEENEKNSFI